MGTASENAAEAQMVKDNLNFFGANDPEGATIAPAPLAPAAALFCAIKIWIIEGLGLLDLCTCTAASCSSNINEDGQLIGNVTISGLSGGKLVNFMVPRFSFILSSLPDTSFFDLPWTIPATLTIVDNQNNSHSISCTIEGDDANSLVVVDVDD